METFVVFVMHGIAWGRNVIGLVTRPYETYRRIADTGRLGELVYTIALAVLYLGLVSVVKVASFRPFLLTRQFAVLFFGAVVNYTVAVGLLWVAGRIIGARGKLRALVVGWGYTLIPTISWFMMTSLLYVVVPPPRTTSTMGIVFSVVFLVMSATLLWWKIMLSYLTIRFVFRLDLLRIVFIYALVVPIVVLESVLMYHWGFFKIPFL